MDWWGKACLKKRTITWTNMLVSYKAAPLFVITKLPKQPKILRMLYSAKSAQACSVFLYISVGDWLPGMFFFPGIRIPCTLFIGSWMWVLPLFHSGILSPMVHGNVWKTARSGLGQHCLQTKGGGFILDTAWKGIESESWKPLYDKLMHR